MNKSYREMILLPTFKERYDYLKLEGQVGGRTFGGNRWLNQTLYQNDPDWRSVRRSVIIRDCGCDLAIADRDIGNYIIVHHINPITDDDIIHRRPILFDPDNLVCVSRKTHQAIHFGDESLLVIEHEPRRPNDTCPWRK